jgi:hypothetical protein
LSTGGGLGLNSSRQSHCDYAGKKDFRFHNPDLNRFNLRRKPNFERAKLFSQNRAKE